MAERGGYAAPPFAERPPWWGGDLQTVRNVLVPWARPDLGRYRARRLGLAMADGSGDRLSAVENRPAADEGRALVVLVHGLTGCAESAYMVSAAAYLLGCGWPVLRLDLRGAGASLGRCRQLYHAGRSEDLRDALAALVDLEPALVERGILLVGFSLGGNMLLKFLAEHVRGLPVLAAASVSAPIDLAAASRRIAAPRNRLYQRYILARMKVEALALGDVLTPGERSAIAAADSVRTFDDTFVAPRIGFAGADEYYAQCGAARFLDGISTPTLVIHARNDPWIPAEAYLRRDWARNPALSVLLPDGGGHVGFHGRGSPVPWHERCIGAFFAERTGDQRPPAVA